MIDAMENHEVFFLFGVAPNSEVSFQVIKTIVTFAFKAQPSINEPLVRELMKGEFIDKREKLLLIGNSGTGKAHLACALASSRVYAAWMQDFICWRRANRSSILFNISAFLVSKFSRAPLGGGPCVKAREGITRTKDTNAAIVAVFMSTSPTKMCHDFVSCLTPGSAVDFFAKRFSRHLPQSRTRRRKTPNGNKKVNQVRKVIWSSGRSREFPVVLIALLIDASILRLSFPRGANNIITPATINRHIREICSQD